MAAEKLAAKAWQACSSWTFFRLGWPDIPQAAAARRRIQSRVAGQQYGRIVALPSRLASTNCRMVESNSHGTEHVERLT